MAVASLRRLPRGAATVATHRHRGPRVRPVARRDFDETLTLADGRVLGYAQFGDRAGRPIFFFHGWGGSRLGRHPDDTIAQALGVRIIAIDRPGIGLSDRKPRPSLLEWPDDVAALADSLGIDRFAVLGWSGGGAFAVACGYRLPDRVTSVGVVSGPAPLAGAGTSAYLRPSWRRIALMAQVAPWVMRAALWRWGRPVRRDPDRFVEAAVAAMVPSDRRVMNDPNMRAILVENALEVYRQGGGGMYEEGLLLARPWGFDPQEVRVPVVWWHGEADLTVPPAMGRHMARALPRCDAHFYPDEGHHLLYERWAEILASVA